MCQKIDIILLVMNHIPN